MAAYPRRAMTDIPPGLVDRWMTRSQQDPAVMVLGQAPRDLVRFNELNLLSSWPMKGKFDAIFCRNVMIYVDQPTQDRIWEKFARVLNPRGILFIGHSERIATERHPFDIDGQTTYRLRGEDSR
jgi:chemotaxis protein methyltransferase CheR